VRQHVGFLIAFLSCSQETLSQTRHEGIILQIDTTYYTVRGSTVDDLRSQVKTLGPQKGGKRFDAGTEYQIRWRNRSVTANGICRFDSVVVHLNVKFIYPRWQIPPSASERLVNTWRRYFTKLLEHENGHLDLALAGCREILQAIKQIQPEITCRAIEEKAESIAEAIVARVQKKQLEYDRVTDHGTTQGVRLDP
jgi:predicted secreted Zn-dependent protease